MGVVVLVLLVDAPALSGPHIAGPPAGSSALGARERAAFAGVPSPAPSDTRRGSSGAGTHPDCSRIAPSDLVPLRPAERNWNVYCSNLHGPTGSSGSSQYPQGFGIYNLAMTDDPYDGYVVLLGANGGSGRMNGTETWTFSNGLWTQIASPQSPESCVGSVMAYDDVDHYVLYLGGGNLAPGSNCTSAGQTWSYRAGLWTQLSPVSSPSARQGAALTNDSADGYLLLFGGISPACGTACNDTWTFVGGNWTQRHPVTSPSNRSGAGMAYDVWDGYVVLFGGSSYAGCTGPEQDALYCMDRDTWAYQAGIWTQLAPVGAVPPEPSDDGLVYDAAAQGAFYTVTDDNFSEGAEIWWTFQGGNWTNPSTNGRYAPTLPRNRFGEGLAYDYRDGYDVMYGGTGVGWGRLADTWAYQNGSWRNLTAASGFSASLSILPSSFDLGGSVTFTTAVFGATQTYSYAYSQLPAGCISGNLSSLFCTPSVSGTFYVTVTVRNATGSAVTASANVVIYPMLTIAEFTVDPSNVTLGSPAAFRVTTSGGGSGLQYSYGGLPNACAGETSAAFACTPTETGEFNVTVLVFDDFEATTATTSLNVSASTPTLPYPPLTIVAFFASPAVVTVGAMTVFEVFVQGGTLPDTFAYTGLPAGCVTVTVAELSCSPRVSGSSRTTVTVTDGAGTITSASTTLFVTPPSVTASTTPANPGPTWLQFGVGSAVTALVVAAVTFLVIRRGRPPSRAP
ncbi:MAG: hypothetical protein L3K18_05340 [Thermoplasmata archaeon]|nr:hypothetical protein [Thermoplasmata archaeon]MCI4356550.1 hypothetical protein [Thermoplasmata archaeon]